MKLKKNLSTSLFIVALTFSLSAFSQSNQIYDYAEIIVLQKVDKKESEVKEIYLNSTTDTNLNKEDISTIKNNSELMKFMNSSHWEFVDKVSSQPSNTGPIWISYTYRKRQ
ncbi:MAG: hypothetical protein R2776_07050 [Flavobacteriaceae bacterium]|nr:hypothetical protein [Flavobacteriaceae bacterium]